ncbi:MAG: S16 family serine protease, partial [Phycisphaerales bacterium]|nr:S16 family serine protease [Phycisphaerales bacterium]
KRAGIRHVIVPRRNEKDMPDVPEEVRRSLKFHFVDNVDEVLKVALSRPRRRGGSRRKVSGTSA